MNSIKILILTISCLTVVKSLEVNETLADVIETLREKKALSVFQVVKFPNAICTSTSSYNGTCYTTSECTNKGGTSSGSCASGFGVCCIFVLGCGGSTSDNSSYIVQSSVTTLTSPCKYTVCPCSTNICRIRFDFTSFSIAGPVTTAVTTTFTGSAIGDCATDAFSINSPGAAGTPVICGFNDGQHMIVDANSLCHTANFNIGSSTTTTRSWNIKITQYACGSEFLGGPPGCLQYFEGSTGTISSYNFPTTSTTVPALAAGTQHLNNQCYQICIRRTSGNCIICYIPAITAAAPNSYGLSTTLAAGQTSATDSVCIADYITIPNGVVTANAATTALYLAAITTSATIGSPSRFCGRFLNIDNVSLVSVSICTRQTPFRINFKTDGDELTGATDDTDSEVLAAAPLGNIGFSLNYVQSSC